MEEYYILCPTRSTQEPALFSHLISRDICAKRQEEQFHKCPTCIRSRIWLAAHPGAAPGDAPTDAPEPGTPAEEQAPV